jgi:hypothetical protein
MNPKMAFWGILSNNIRLFLYSANKLTEMKKLLVICAFLSLVGTELNAQTVYSVKYEAQADVKVYVVEYESQADLLVYKEDYSSRAKGNEGNWFFVDYQSQANKSIYFVKYESQADLKIYFVKYESKAGWRNKEKIHLMY